jgi:tetratricopeptide (TPR) repeat protein
MRLNDLFPALTGCDPELPKDVDSLSPLDLMRRANALADSKSFPRALNYYDLALQNEPRAPEIWFNLGKTLSDMGKIAEAITCYDKCIELCPSFVSAWNNKGSALAKSNRFQEAKICFERAIEIDPGHPHAMTGAACCVSTPELQALLQKQPTALPSDTTPGQYLSVLRFQFRKMQELEFPNGIGTATEVPVESQELGKFLADLGYDVKKIFERGLPEDFAHFRFQLILKELPAELRQSLEDETVFAVGELPIESVNAESIIAPNGGWVVVVRNGLFAFIYELARILSTRFVAVDREGKRPFAEALTDMQVTSSLLREFFTRFASIGVPRGRDFPIAPPQMMIANGLAMAAERFVICHEIGHLSLGHLKQSATKAWRSDDGLEFRFVQKNWEEEFAADRTGTNILLRSASSNEDKLTAYAGVELFLQMCTVLEDMQQFKGSWTHPPTRQRLNNIRAHGKSLCADSTSYDAIMQRPLVLESMIERARADLLNAGHSYRT